jgi:dihydrofolate reductase
MKTYHLVAYSNNHVIGKNNQLPWHFSVDLKHFKNLTMGHTIVMGRKTFDSIGKPLPGRANFVLSRSARGGQSKNLKFFASISEALRNAKTEKVFIIGGEEVYRQTMDKIDGIYLTEVKGDYEGDVYYPAIPEGFKEISRERLKEEKNLEFVFLEKVESISSV